MHRAWMSAEVARRIVVGATLAAVLVPIALADVAADAAASALRERQVALAPKLQDNTFGQPLYLESAETTELASGDIYAVLPHPYGVVAGALKKPGQWCDVLILHLNVKHCAAATGGITLHLGSKHEQPLDQAYRLELRYAVPADIPDYLRVQMQADSGPLGTRDYGFQFEATALPSGRTFVHFRYTVGYGRLGRLAMQGYLGTVGRDKIGFSRIPSGDGENAQWVAGTRGAVERNAMRYYLAIAAYLDGLTASENERTERRLQAWFSATERYPRQLHEITRDEYMEMKRHELR